MHYDWCPKKMHYGGPASRTHAEGYGGYSGGSHGYGGSGGSSGGYSGGSAGDGPTWAGRPTADCSSSHDCLQR